MTERVLTPAEIGQEAQSVYQQGDYHAAERLFQAAVQAYTLAGDPLMAAEMTNDRSVALMMAGDAGGALAEAEKALATFEQAADRKRMALALGNRAAALDALHRTDEAMLAYEQCAEILKELHEDELRAYALQALSKIYLRKGKPLEALVWMRAGIHNLPHPSLHQRLLKNLLDYPFKLTQGGK